MTLCNMTIEASARVGLIVVDETTIEYLCDRPCAPRRAVTSGKLRQLIWRTLVSDAGARFDRTVQIDARELRPMITWGTSPEMVVGFQLTFEFFVA